MQDDARRQELSSGAVSNQTAILLKGRLVKSVAVVCSLILIALSSVVSAAPKRDEAKASRFLYCSALNSYWVYAQKEAQADSSEIDDRQGFSDNLWVAAELLSDEAFARAHKSDALQQVRAVLEGADKDEGAGLLAEDQSCASTFRDQAIPLLKAEHRIPGDDMETSVPVHQIGNVTRDIVEWHAMKHPDCPFQNVSGAKIVKREKDSVTEHWTIQACAGRQFTYRVFILPHEGGLTDAVGDVEVAEDAPGKP